MWLPKELGGLKIEGYEYRPVASKLAGAPRQRGGGGCPSRCAPRRLEEEAQAEEEAEEAVETRDVAVQTVLYVPEQWGMQTVPVLRAELARRLLHTGGLKAELVDRLAVDDAVGIRQRLGAA